MKKYGENKKHPQRKLILNSKQNNKVKNSSIHEPHFIYLSIFVNLYFSKIDQKEETILQGSKSTSILQEKSALNSVGHPAPSILSYKIAQRLIRSQNTR